jgi:undecaprenyl diphosphate synthase
MNLIGDVIERELDELNAEGVQLRHIGHLDGLNEDLVQKVKNAIQITKNNQRLILTLAFNYGGRDELLCAIKQMLRDGIKPEEVNEELVAKYLLTQDLPDPDLVIRTSGEMRTSNFLPWQATYAEWYFTPTLWPDFDENNLVEAISDYSHRERRFGRVNPIICPPC